LPELFTSGIDALDKVLPRGIPRNNMMVLAGELGTGKSVLMSQLLYGVLKRQKQPCIYLTFEGPPVAVQQDMESFGWNITPFL
jgi:KaiC/GvpD/RAD55 family RecA-like ATPase